MRRTRAKPRVGMDKLTDKVFALSINARSTDDSAGTAGYLPCAIAVAAKAGDP
jgi:hypothetical protein